MKNLINDALKYTAQGFSIIPVGQNKKPLINWKEFQERKASEEEVRKWFKEFPDANIGMVTGKISNMVVVDVENGGSIDGLSTTVISKTGGGGWHYFYKYPENGLNNATRIREKMDIRGDGGYVVLPPSLHSSGNRYEWKNSPEMATLAELPKWVKNIRSENQKNVTDWDKFLKTTNPEGTRNTRTTQITGKLLKHLPQNLWHKAGHFIKGWNKEKNDPPLPEKEIENVITSIASSESNKNKIKPIHISELMKKEFGDIEWLVEKLVPLEGITAVSGAPASFKTWVMLELAIRVAKKEDLFDRFATSKTGVLLIDEENGERLFQRRLKMFKDIDGLNIYILSLEKFKLSNSSVKELIIFCKKKEIGLIVFDSLVRIHEGNENDAMDMSSVFGMLKQLNKVGITVIFTHHHRKQGALRSSNPSQDMRGSSDILAAVDCHIALERKDSVVTIRQTKARNNAEIKPIQLDITIEDDNLAFEYIGEIDESESIKDAFKKAIKDLLSQEAEPMHKTGILNTLKKLGIRGEHSTFKNAMNELIEDEEVFTKKGERNKIYCSIKPFEKEQMNRLKL